MWPLVCFLSYWRDENFEFLTDCGWFWRPEFFLVLKESYKLFQFSFLIGPPLRATLVTNSLLASINLAVGTLLVICSLLSYYKACLVNAGSVPQDWVRNTSSGLVSSIALIAGYLLTSLARKCPNKAARATKGESAGFEK